ncbi:SixA phosphatase family protein [Pseudonocardia hispaniensis]|uniref:SixA phosphatase family protein n=1 Tax=Pseudonocardia hispaniensis TaxID=904933 RepID=A0ABW1J2S1_9PSEU
MLLRHAKSAWPDGVPDPNRPLGKRGLRDAPAVGRWLRAHVGGIDTVVCSPALRTRQTWELASGELDDPPAPRFDERVYAANARELLTVVRKLPEEARTAVLVGHNPALQEFVELLSGVAVEMKTSAIAVAAWSSGWADADARVAVLEEHATPRG